MRVLHYCCFIRRCCCDGLFSALRENLRCCSLPCVCWFEKQVVIIEMFFLCLLVLLVSVHGLSGKADEVKVYRSKTKDCRCGDV